MKTTDSAIYQSEGVTFFKLLIMIFLSIVLFVFFIGICLFEIFRPIVMEEYCSRKIAKSLNSRDDRLIKPKDLGDTRLGGFTYGDNDQIFLSFYKQLKCEQNDKLFYIF